MDAKCEWRAATQLGNICPLQSISSFDLSRAARKGAWEGGGKARKHQAATKHACDLASSSHPSSLIQTLPVKTIWVSKVLVRLFGQDIVNDSRDGVLLGVRKFSSYLIFTAQIKYGVINTKT